RLVRNLGLARLPQAGVTIGLLLTVKQDAALASVLDTLVAVVLAVVTLNEIVGPVLTRFALKRSGETGMDRMRLIDFLGEENIVTGLHAKSMPDAIEQLTEILFRSHGLPNDVRGSYLQSVLDR